MNTQMSMILSVTGAIIAALSALFTWMAARHARRSADAAYQTLEVSTRPWLGVMVLDRKGELGLRSPLFSLSLKNFGSLPAYLVEHRLNWSVIEPAIEPSFSTENHCDSLILNPDQEIVFSAPGPALKTEDLNAIQRGQPLFVWFSILYRDPLNQEHTVAQIARSTTQSADTFTWIPKANYWRSD
jgi:hypothetical protein